ncbi:HvfC/BufC family peptide modification chaperone [Sphingomicrobium arenosum]|uniref:HvfC/BufC family peptide modification chaperone n=1 Tax=Sphingomicrobium arenosum TaxID=2233861 RepID=UPI00223F204A|nr:putative DNA-binding domain-containing protein [Sphingomicrobium arenosum]
MQPDAHIALADTLAHGPARLPADLLAGPRAAQLRGLKAYANTISHARHVALEDSYPRLRDAMGHGAFHDAARAFFLAREPRRRPLRLIGAGFAETLTAPAQRDLARAEWLWLEAHGAPDAPAVGLATIAGLTPEALLAARVAAHPALRSLALEDPASFAWDGVEPGATHLLVTRPEARRAMNAITPETFALACDLNRPATMTALLERDPAATTALVAAGALTPVPELL